MTHIGNLVGYALGALNLSSLSFLAFLGGGQFRQLAVLSCVAMITTVGITCNTQQETIVEGGGGDGLSGIIAGIYREAKDLDEGVKRVCAVQICAWSAWFPFLFYT